MMRSLYSGVSGLKNHQTRMDVVGNNISNVNTTGFKSGRVTFADTLSQTLSGASLAADGKGGTNPKQIGLGSSVSAIDTLFTDGSVQSTGVNTDLCMSGNALFVVASDSGSAKDVYYTRNGNFKFDSSGCYVNSDGLKVQGWMADDSGTVTVNPANTDNIVIEAGKSMAAKATKDAVYTKNLDAAEPVITSIAKTVVNAAGNATVTNVASSDVPDANTSLKLTFSDGTTRTISGKTTVTYKVGNSEPKATTATVYDSEGSAHDIIIMLEKTGANEWYASLNGIAGPTTKTITESDNSTTTINLAAAKIPFKPDGSYNTNAGANGVMNLAYSNGNGAAAQQVTIDFSGLTQYAGSTTAYCSADGNAAGTLKSVSVDSSGYITGTYTNGLNKIEALVATALFNNPAGLVKMGNSLYKDSNNSGTKQYNSAGANGSTITPSALEMSNVDMASELTDMIVTQRGYQSNSKIITVSDELLETLINMKR